MLIKINHLKNANDDLEQTVLELNEIIWERLDQERAGLEAQQREHEENIKIQMEDNTSRKNEMRSKLMTL